MQKKKLLIVPFDLLSHYLRCITLAKNYGDYEIYFASSKKYNRFVIEAGYSIVELEQFNPEEVMACTRKFNFDWLNEKDIERVFKSQVEAIRHLQADLLLGDTSPTLKMAAEYTGIGYCALMNAYMSVHYKYVRKISRTHYSYQYLSHLPDKLAEFITSLAEKAAFRSVHAPFKKLRKKYGLKSISSYLLEMEGDENVLCDDPELFPQKKLPPNYSFVGPILYNSSIDSRKLLQQLHPEKKTVCVCMGSTGEWDALSFLSEEKYSNFNILLAANSEKSIDGTHVFHADFINLNTVLPHCCLMICHGGNGTMYEGLRHKVPMLCLTSHFEQEWNVHMLERNGFGRSINDAPQALIDEALERLRC